MISVVVLTHNDEEYIERTLQSVAWCDELIVIDDQSTDTTIEKVKEYTHHIITHALSNDFAAQRNLGLKEARGEWVLFVDSDEVVSDELKAEIENITHHPSSGSVLYAGYFLKRTDYMWGKPLTHGETADVRLLRLGKKGKGKWTRPVHEVWNIVGKTRTIRTPLLHFPHPTLREFIRDVNRYSTVNANLHVAQKTSVGVWHIVAYPVAKFFRNYVWLRGYNDGVPGFCVAMVMSFHSFLTRAKLYMHYHKRDVQLP